MLPVLSIKLLEANIFVSQTFCSYYSDYPLTTLRRSEVDDQEIHYRIWLHQSDYPVTKILCYAVPEIHHKITKNMLLITPIKIYCMYNKIGYQPPTPVIRLTPQQADYRATTIRQHDHGNPYNSDLRPRSMIPTPRRSNLCTELPIFIINPCTPPAATHSEKKGVRKD